MLTRPLYKTLSLQDGNYHPVSRFLCLLGRFRIAMLPIKSVRTQVCTHTEVQFASRETAILEGTH